MFILVILAVSAIHQSYSYPWCFDHVIKENQSCVCHGNEFTYDQMLLNPTLECAQTPDEAMLTPTITNGCGINSYLSFREICFCGSESQTGKDLFISHQICYQEEPCIIVLHPTNGNYAKYCPNGQFVSSLEAFIEPSRNRTGLKTTGHYLSAENCELCDTAPDANHHEDYCSVHNTDTQLFMPYLYCLNRQNATSRFQNSWFNKGRKTGSSCTRINYHGNDENDHLEMVKKIGCDSMQDFCSGTCEFDFGDSRCMGENETDIGRIIEYCLKPPSCDSENNHMNICHDFKTKDKPDCNAPDPDKQWNEWLFGVLQSVWQENIIRSFNPDGPKTKDCDGEIDCLDGSDEDFEKCKDTFPDSATVYCKQFSYFDHYDIYIFATPCDGIVECQGGIDEDCDVKLGKLVLILFGAFIFTSLVSGLVMMCHSSKIQPPLMPLPDHVFNSYNERDLFGLHQTPKLAALVSEECENEPFCLMLAKLELEIHDNDMGKVTLCLRSNLDPKSAKSVLKSMKRPSFLQKSKNWLKQSFENYWETLSYLKAKSKKKIEHYLLTGRYFLGNFLYFMDPIKDLALTFKLYLILNATSETGIFSNLSLFQNIVFLQLVCSITIPMLLTGCQVAINAPYLPFGLRTLPQCLWKRSLLRLACIVLCPIIPLLLNAHDKYLQFLCKDKNNPEHLKYKRKIKVTAAQAIKIDLGLETLYQLAGQLVLLGYGVSRTRTEQGLNSIFTVENIRKEIVLLVLSIMWSFISCVRSHLRGLSGAKEKFGIFSKVVIGSFAMLCIISRLFAIVMLMTPSLGLFSILEHYEGSKKPYSLPIVEYFSKKPGNYGNVPYKDIIDSHYTDLLQYIHFSAGQCYQAFFALVGIQTLVIFAIKSFTSKAFKKWTIFDKVIHCLQNSSIPFPVEDWEESVASMHQYQRKKNQVEKEMFLIIALNYLINAIMLAPLVLFGMTVSYRHTILLESIGANSDEKIAFVKTILLMSLGSIGLMVMAGLQYLLYYLFNGKYHPYSQVLANQKKKYLRDQICLDVLKRSESDKTE